MAEEHTGKSSGYYSVYIRYPTTPDRPEYWAECNDIIEALGMDYSEGNIFKGIWRRCAARNLDLHKKGNNARYDAEKIHFFAERLLRREEGLDGG